MALRWEWACPRWWCISQQMGWLIWLLGMCTYPLLRSRPLRVPPLRRLTLESPKVSKGLLPHHSVPRLGSACPQPGIAPWARRDRPSMAVSRLPRHPCRGAHCAIPAWGHRGLTGCLRSRSKARSKAKQQQSNSRARARSCIPPVGAGKPAPTGICVHLDDQVGCQAASLCL